MDEENQSSIKEITSKSKKEEIAKFFSDEFNLPENIKDNIIKQDISGDILLDLKDKDFQILGLKKEQIKKIRDYLSDNNENFMNVKVDAKINNNSTKEDVEKLFKDYIGFNGKIKNLDGKKFLNLTQEKIDELGLNIGQTKKLEKYLKKCKIKNKRKKLALSYNKNNINKNSKIIENKETSKEEEIDKNKNIIKKVANSLNIEKEEDKIILDKKEESNILLDKNIQNSSFIWNFLPNLNFSGIWSKNQDELSDNNQKNQTITKKSIKSNIIINNNENIVINPKGNVLSYIQYQKLIDRKVKPLYTDSNYNLFFILVISNEFYDSSLSFYEDKSCTQLWKVIVNYNHIILIDDEIVNNDDKKRLILIQIPSERMIHKFSVSLICNNKEKKSQIEIKEDIKNYFDFKNLNFDGNFPEEKTDFILNTYFDYFIKKDINNFDLTKNLIESAINLISLTNNTIYFTNNNLFKFFKLSLDYNFKINNINLIEFNKEEIKDNIIDKDYMLTGKEIDKLFTLFEEVPDLDKIKEKLSLFFVYSYNKNNKKYIKSLLQSKNKNIYKRNIFDLLLKGDLQINDINFKEKKNVKKFQQDILYIAQSLNEINYIIKLFENILESLEFINKNCTLIYKILDVEKETNKLNQINNYLILPNISNDDNTELILEYLSSIVENCKNKDYLILNYEKIFLDFYNLYSDKSLEELCQLKKLINLFDEKNIYPQVLENYYNQIHQKGMNLIKDKKLSIPKIINFIKKQDVYYIEEKYKNSVNRDPSIFKYINILDFNKKIIELFHKNKIITLFNNSYSKLIQFYEAFLSQINKIKDFECLFKLFPESSINKTFIELINKKYNHLIKRNFKEEIKNETNQNEIYEILQKIYIFNSNFGIDIVPLLKKVERNSSNAFITNFYIFLIKNKVENIIDKIKTPILGYFIGQLRNRLNPELLIYLSIISPDDSFFKYLLNEMDNFILNENDFYQKEENAKFILFKLFYEKWIKTINNNKKLFEGKYILETMQLKSKILSDLDSGEIKYELIDNLIDEENSFYSKIVVITDFNKDNADRLYTQIKELLIICKDKFNIFETIIDFYSTFYKVTKRNVINEIKEKINIYKKYNLIDIINLANHQFINDENIDIEDIINESSNIKYKYSCFFMSIYRDKFNKEKFEKTEDEIFKNSIEVFKDTLTKIITHKKTGDIIYRINYIDNILKLVRNKNINMNEEIDFLCKEFPKLNQDNDNYIKNNLLNDLVIYSYRETIAIFLKGIINFINVFLILKHFELTKTFDILNKCYEEIILDTVTTNQIEKIIEFLFKQLEYNIKDEKTSLMEFYELLIDKGDSIMFIKKIKDTNLDIRNLNEFIDEQENSQLQTSDIDNLLDIYTFFNSLMNNKILKTDLHVLIQFKKEFEREKNIDLKIKEYLKCYGEIIQFYQMYHENPEIATQKIEKILTNSNANFYKNKNNLFTFQIQYHNQNNELKNIDINELKELRYKIYMSSTNTNLLNSDYNKIYNQINKEDMTNQFVNLIDNIKQLNNTLNNLIKSGYPFTQNFNLTIKNSEAFYEKDKNKTLQKIIELYKIENKNFKKLLKDGYETKPLLRLFYGNQFIQLYDYLIKKNNNINNIVNYVTLGKIKKYDVKYEYNNQVDFLFNINNYLNILFQRNNVNIDEIYNLNKVYDNFDLHPGLYRKIKFENYSELTVEIINLYFNLTGNFPIRNTLLFCNEETTIEQIRAFLYRAIFCEYPILFVIYNMEYLSLSITQNIIKIIKKLSKLKNINSYLLFIYEKADSGLSREIEKLIPERNILNNNFFKQSKKRNNNLDKTIVYSSLFSGYGKTTEIKYRVKESNGLYFYLPIGGEFNRDYIIKNLNNLNMPLQNTKNVYLHLDLSDSDKDELINEILFKLIILRYLDSNDKIFSLSSDINIIIEISKGFINFEKKYKILNLFKNIQINKLAPLILEPQAKTIRASPIATVAEVLNYYEKKIIGKKNIDLDAPINMSSNQCEKIINKYFNVENQNYYQKMNFIKILSLQFIKFTENVYFNYEYAEQDGIGSIIETARISAIQNFIGLTKVFTRSPYDQLLIKKQSESIDLFNKYEYDKNKEIENAINDLEKQKQEIFSFDLIKPSLVFFNRDGGSLSIISNNNPYEPEYKALYSLWNSRNVGLFSSQPLIDYKNLNHEQFLEQIKILFSLDNMSIKNLKNICVEQGNYIFVCDNFIKMVRILLNIESKIPVILMGETGVGKTKILEMLAILYGKGKLNWKKKEIHAGTTDEEIVSFIDEIIEEENKKIKFKKENEELVWVFLDEINTCNSLGLITEIMCNHTYLGKKINDNFVFLGACNPYRVLNKKMRETGLVYYNIKEKNKLNNLVYSVNPLPHALLNFVFDFGSLKAEDERKYITNTVISIIENILENELIRNISQKEINKLLSQIIDSIVICHDFIREKYDKSSVSMREIRRFGMFFEHFIKYFSSNDNSDYQKMILSLNMTLYLCYYLRLNDKLDRRELVEKLKKYYPKSSFLSIPENIITKIAKEMIIEKNKGIALNRILKENLFTCFTCIINKVPLIIIGKPGTGKSLSFQILFNSMKGEYSESKLFKDKGKLYRYYYQGSETSTAEGIKQVFKKALISQSKTKNKKIIPLVFFDEMGLAERSSNNPLKVIHFLLERDSENSVPFLGTSNWKLDAAKNNRTLTLSITDYDIQDLEETAISIAEAMDYDLTNKYIDFFNTLAKVYNEYMLSNKNNLENKDFHGNRDFYNLIKNAMKMLIIRKKELIKNEKKILNEIGNLSLERNFGGLENSTNSIKNIFNKEYGNKSNENIESSFNILKIIKENISESNSRYLMLISDGNDAGEILKYLLSSINRKYIEIVGSKYKIDTKSGRYTEEILNKIKYIMETDNILILKDLDIIYPSLYDLFNQNFTIMGNKQFARIAFEYAKISSEVNPNFHVVILVDNIQIQNLKLDPPFLNRFEKHILNYRMLLNEEDIKIAEKITNFINLISTFNNNKNLKIDLEKLLINCKQHDIEGLIFKIKNNFVENKKNKNKYKEIDYESFIIKEVFEKITPTFCQDIIASIISSNLNNKYYDDLKDMILNIYKNKKYNNFISFFKNITLRKNIIYTFSKVTENLFEENKIIKNKYGAFNNKSAFIEMIDSIKSENDFLFLLESFNNSKNKNILILKFTENDINKINSVNFLLNNYQLRSKKLQNCLILFIIHRKREIKNNKIKNNKNIPNLISFINDEFEQLFIDNLQGKENNDIFKIISKNIPNNFIKESNFIDNHIYSILNYINYNILFETKEINSKNYISEIAQRIIQNKIIKDLFQTNIEKQGNSSKDIIIEVLTSDVLEVNDVDFMDVINSKLVNIYSLYFLKIILTGFKDNILNQLLINKNYEIFLQNDFFKNIIMKYFEKKTFNFVPPIKLGINKNNITIYNGLQIPHSKIYFDKIIKYVNDEINERFIENENLLRKHYENKEETLEIIEMYENQLKKIEYNIKNELNKYDFFKEIYNKNIVQLKTLITEDYLKYYIIKIIDKKETDFIINENIYNILLLIIKFILNKEENINNFTFLNNINEFIKIIEITQSYKEDIINIIDIILNIKKYFKNFEDYIIDSINSKIIKYNQLENNNYSKIVNNWLFSIIESLLRAILLSSVELIQNDKLIFYDYLKNFRFIEANIQKINKKYNLNSKQILNLRLIIKIEEVYKDNQNEFEVSYKNITKNLLKQSVLLYNEEYKNLYQMILDLKDIINLDFKIKNEEYMNLLFFIFRQHYQNINDEQIKIKLIKNIFENETLIKKCYVFLDDTMNSLKPRMNINGNENDEKNLVNNFLNLNGYKELIKYRNLFEYFNSIESTEFKELLIYFFETQCQSYFYEILSFYNNEFSELSCEAILLKTSLLYLKKSIQYLFNYKNENKNNILKINSIAYIKTYFYYYVEINYKYFDKCNFNEINELLMSKNENNTALMQLINIYIFRIYFTKFENFEQFKNFNFSNRNIPIYNKIFKQLENEEKESSNYIFKNNFINPKDVEICLDIINFLDSFRKDNNTDKKLTIQINKNFDIFYCCLVNRMISYLYGNNKKIIVDKLQILNQLITKKIKFSEEGQILFNYLLNYEYLKKNIFNKIPDEVLNQKDFEILLYSFRFIYNTSINNNSFYNNLIKKGTSKFINDNYIPGSFPYINEYIKSYNSLIKEPMKEKTGYYICKDCGYLYEVPPCSFPTSQSNCPNGHIIGGINHKSIKKDLRIFNNHNQIENLKNITYIDYETRNSFTSLTLSEFKSQYVDKYLFNIEKGIINNFTIQEFTKNDEIRGNHIITYRLLNFILYSFLLGSYILNNLTENHMKKYLVENLFPHSLFGIIKKNWELLNTSLISYGFTNINTFINMTFNDILKFINNLKNVDTKEKMIQFEKSVDKYIRGILKDKNEIKKLNNEYMNINNKLLNCNPQSLKEIIQSNYPPSIYSPKQYPDIQYYTVSENINFYTFIKKFNLHEENKNKYSLINLLINIDSDVTKNALNLKYLLQINKLENILLNIYSYKISRDESKAKVFNDEIPYIIKIYNEMNSKKLNNDKEFEKEYINPFIKGWNEIKNKSTQYKCRILRDLGKGEKPFEINNFNCLSDFLVDDGDKESGMFLAAAYQYFIESQNNFINEIIEKNNFKGILNSYVSQLKQTINIQDVSKNEILILDGNLYKYFNELIITNSMRNIFTDNKNEINYKNYNDIIFDFDSIEEELGKKLLPGLKKFNVDKIRFVTYLYEEFRGENSSILSDYINKYNQRDLEEFEKERLIHLVEINNKNNRFYNDVFSSLQILMKEILKENYEQDYLLYEVIEKLPNYIRLNEELINFFKKYYDYKLNKKLFSVNSLIGIFDYFEALCWFEIQNHIPPDYKQDLSEDIIHYINKYFEAKYLNKIINKENFTYALRKLISRYISGERQDTEIKNDAKLKFYIIREDLWNKNVLNSENFEEEINEIFKKEILIGQAMKLYLLLDGNKILYEKLYKNKYKDLNKDKIIQENNNLNKINIPDNMNIININKNLKIDNIKEEKISYLDSDEEEENEDKNEDEYLI